MSCGQIDRLGVSSTLCRAHHSCVHVITDGVVPTSRPWDVIPISRSSLTATPSHPHHVMDGVRFKGVLTARSFFATGVCPPPRGTRSRPVGGEPIRISGEELHVPSRARRSRGWHLYHGVSITPHG